MPYLDNSRGGPISLVGDDARAWAELTGEPLEGGVARVSTLAPVMLRGPLTPAALALVVRAAAQLPDSGGVWDVICGPGGSVSAHRREGWRGKPAETRQLELGLAEFCEPGDWIIYHGDGSADAVPVVGTGAEVRAKLRARLARLEDK